jgi:hypothetical protein
MARHLSLVLRVGFRTYELAPDFLTPSRGVCFKQRQDEPLVLVFGVPADFIGQCVSVLRAWTVRAAE